MYTVVWYDESDGYTREEDYGTLVSATLRFQSLLGRGATQGYIQCCPCSN